MCGIICVMKETLNHYYSVPRMNNFIKVIFIWYSNHIEVNFMKNSKSSIERKMIQLTVQKHIVTLYYKRGSYKKGYMWYYRYWLYHQIRNCLGLKINYEK